MKILVILEAPTLDQYVVKPIVERLFEDLGRRVEVFEFLFSAPASSSAGTILPRMLPPLTHA